jgi:hypothetical protein
LAGILALFGFANCEKYPPVEYGTPEYGTPHATYKLQENVINQQDTIPKTVDIVLKEKEWFALIDE